MTRGPRLLWEKKNKRQGKGKRKQTNPKERSMLYQRVHGKVQLPDQLVVDIQLEFGMKIGKTDTERGPVMRRKDREEVVDRRAVSTK